MVTIRWFDPDDDAAIAAPPEWGFAWGALELGDVPLRSVRVSSGGERLPVSRRQVDGGERVGFRWPRRDPGHHVVTLEVPGATLNIPVRVAPRKLDDEARGAMLEQLTLGLPTEIAWTLDPTGAWAGAAASRHDRVTIAGEVERLRRATFGAAGGLSMSAAAARIAHDPRAELVADHRWTRLERVRLPAPGRLAESWRRMNNVDAQGTPFTLVERVSRLTVDTYENRLAFAWVSRVAAALRWLTPHCSPEALAPINQELRAAQRSLAALGHVRPLAGTPTHASLPLLRRPEYRAAFDGLVALTRRTAARLDDEVLRGSLDALPGLYQRWGALRVIAAVLRGAERHGWRVRLQRLVSAVVGDSVVRLVPNGQAVLIIDAPGSGATLSVIAERTYGTSGGLRSMTYSQRPDIVVERMSMTGERAVWIFDPKYKLVADELGETKPAKADVDKMHAYRDAVRDADGRPVVRLAALLYLGQSVRWSDGLVALRAHPLHVDELDADLDAALTWAFRDA